MMLKTDLEALENPLSRAYAIQHQMVELRMRLEFLEAEYNQIVSHCRDNKKIAIAGYDLIVERKERRTVDPVLFAARFPEANDVLVQSHVAYMETELRKIVAERVLPSITVENAKRHVGDDNLSEACKISYTERVKITCNPQP